jgi:phage tail sheath gpL-like
MPIQDILSINYLEPFVANKLDFSRAVRGLRGMPRRLLLIGQKLAAGTAANNGLLRAVGTEADAIAYFGEGSMLVAMWRAATANAGLGLPIDCIAVPAAAGAAAASSEVVFSTAGATLGTSGDVQLYIGGVRVGVGAQAADTGATIAAALVAAINAVPSLPVTAAIGSATNKVLLTCRWAGPSGNSIDVRATYYTDDRLPVGLTVVIPPMAGGAGTPDITAAIAAMVGYRATELVCAFTDNANLALLEAELEARWLANNMQDGQAVTCVRSADSATALTWLASRNSAQVHTIMTKNDVSNPWETAAEVGAAIESQAALDPAVPHMGISLAQYKGPVQGQGWAGQEPNNLLLAGGSVLKMHVDYTGELSRMVTNYEHNGAGAPDRSKSSLNAIKTMSYKRWFNVTEFQTKYYNFKIAEYVDEAIPGQEIMTKELGEDIMIGIYLEFMKVGLMQNLPYYKQTLVVEIDGTNGRLKVQDEPVLIGQHYQTAITTYPILGHV